MRCSVVTAVFVLVACGGEEEDSVVKRCQRVRDRIIDLRLESASKVDRSAHREAMREALGSEFINSCSQAMTAKQRQCVLDARDLASATACTTAR